MITASDLLAGPRGRDLCLAVLCEIPDEPGLWNRGIKAADLAVLSEAVAGADLAAVAASTDAQAHFDDVIRSDGA